MEAAKYTQGTRAGSPGRVPVGNGCPSEAPLQRRRRAAQDLIRAVCNAGVHLCMGQTRTAEQLQVTKQNLSVIASQCQLPRRGSS